MIQGLHNESAFIIQSVSFIDEEIQRARANDLSSKSESLTRRVDSVRRLCRQHKELQQLVLDVAPISKWLVVPSICSQTLPLLCDLQERDELKQCEVMLLQGFLDGNLHVKETIMQVLLAEFSDETGKRYPETRSGALQFTLLLAQDSQTSDVRQTIVDKAIRGDSLVSSGGHSANPIFEI